MAREESRSIGRAGVADKWQAGTAIKWLGECGEHVAGRGRQCVSRLKRTRPSQNHTFHILCCKARIHPRIGDTGPDRQAYQHDPVVIVTAFSVYMEIYIVQASLDRVCSGIITSSDLAHSV